MAQNGWKQAFDDTYLHKLFYTQVFSMDQQGLFNYPMVTPKVPTTLMTPYSYPMGHHSHLFVSKNGRKRLILIFSMGQREVINYPMVSPKVPTTLKTAYSSPMGHHSHSFVSKNGRKWLKTGYWWCLRCPLLNLLFYIKECFMGQKVVFNYPMVFPKVPPTLMTPNSYPIGHHSLSSVSKNGC
jgi:hypothetical protein